MSTRGNPDWGRPNLINRLARALTLASRSRQAFDHLVGTHDVAVAAQHLTYAEIELLGLGPPNLASLPSFCVCRNPFDRAVSSVTHFYGSMQDPVDFERALDIFLDRPLADHNMRAHRRPQYEFILDARGRPAVEHVLRYEQINKDFSNFMEEIGRPDFKLSWTGQSVRKRDVTAWFTPHARRRVESAFYEDLEHFTYTLKTS